MRLFAAVLPPPDVVAELARAAAPLRDLPGADRLRWMSEEGWHFTLAFYGEVPYKEVRSLSRFLAGAAAESEPFPLAVAGGGHFGGRALWAGASGDTAALTRLAGRTQQALPEDRREHRGYRPHLTLARSGGHADFAAYAALLDDFRGTTWQVEEVALVRSNLPGGADGARLRYEKVGGWRLGAAR
ncbi:RNA 2',3'-cyclic phosphodiesterase [Streptomyces sp. NA04227]|uniref:RNA 2',3'-cyclic phosphodiesterase n=1 Tax=Streptomyces sp. NA04227 TaxID=2742136 RepID=UPI001592AE1B|nr:RNA 2',3'-cyclic phosphodiesterase [Streptomyces sp. NA04227]QKW07218.1 RNA 2',3'-cyclic phosphodiesterase [Streptomyces sp. NA04227]